MRLPPALSHCRVLRRCQPAQLRVRVFQDAKEASNTFNKGKETILDFTNTEGTVTLVEGNILRVEYNPIIMKKGGGFNFD